MASPYIESLFFNLVSQRSESMANLHFIASSKPTPSETHSIQDQLSSNLDELYQVNSKIDILTKLFPDLNNLLADTSQDSKPEKGSSSNNETFEPQGSSIYEDGELVRKPNKD